MERAPRVYKKICDPYYGAIQTVGEVPDIH